MKRVKMIVSAAVVFAVVGSALAFKTVSNSNIRFCSETTGLCIAQTQGYSTDVIGDVVTPPSTPYTGTVGAECGSAQCPEFTGDVHINQ